MPVKKRKAKSGKRKSKTGRSGGSSKRKSGRRKSKKRSGKSPKARKKSGKGSASRKKRQGRRPKPGKERFTEESELRRELELQGKDIFYPEKRWTFSHWVKKYSPVLITLLIGLATYFYLVFYLFYPAALLHGHYVQLLILLVFIFLVAGILIYLGLRAELLFVRILSFIFVFVIFTFLLLFILLANTMNVLGGQA